MTMYPRTALSVCLGACLFFVGCDGDGKSGSDTGTDTSEAQQQQQKEPTPTKGERTDSDDRKNGEVAQRREATSEGAVVDEKAPLHVQEIFVPDELAELFEVEPDDRMRIPGREPSPNYNSQRLTFEGHDGFGLGVQVWAFEDANKAESRFEDLRDQYLNVSEAEVIPEGSDEAFASVRGSLRTIVAMFAEPEARIMAVTCDTGLCSEPAFFEELMEMAGTRLETTYRD